MALDGGTGEVHPDPDAATEAAFAARIEAAHADTAALAAYASVAPRTRDGTAITVAANIGSLAELDRAAEAGAMGIGLLRTEFLFMDRAAPPSEDEQVALYAAALNRFPDHPVVSRTLDIGGDKTVRGCRSPREDNPFLGLRGIRLCLAQPELFRTQLRALLRAATRGRLHVMLPMVSDLSDLRAARALIEDCRAELAAEGVAFGEFALGIMIETPAAVFLAETLAREAAFFYIGTNDLVQYVMVADRMNPAVARLCRADNPAVLAAVRKVRAAAARAGI